MNKIPILFILVGLFNCKAQDKVISNQNDYLRWVGDIEFDPQLDAGFKTCHGDTVFQYFNFSQGFQYEGEKKAIEDIFKKEYKPIQKISETGLLRIRFIVNCEGKTGMFRTMGMDENYKEKYFDKAIEAQLLQITKNLHGWKILPDTEKPKDYYQYLIFKIQHGELKEILP